jgi:endonuclease YncB( thermonuclease family)
MKYTVLLGKFVIRYPDLPRQGPEPDGDTVKFQPDTPALVQALDRPSGGAPGLNSRGISVRLEAIDALETHFQGTHQDLPAANAAREELLRHLGFSNVRFFPDRPNQVESADSDRMPGYVLSNGIDANGRMIGFVFAGPAPYPDGSQVSLTEADADQSANLALLSGGLVYPAFYSTMPDDLREHIGAVAQAARAGAGPLSLWGRTVAVPDAVACVTGRADLETLLIWPKLFRRLVSYFATGASDLGGLDAWLRADPVNRDDAVRLPRADRSGRLHDVLTLQDATVQLTVWPWELVIQPDPA